VFLNLLVHAEQSLAEAEQKTITVRSSLLANAAVENLLQLAAGAAQTGGDRGRSGVPAA